MADTGKIITIGEAKGLLPSSFPDASGDELNRCPKKSELIANGFSITGISRTYEDNQAVVATDIGGYDIKYTFSDAKVVFSTTYPANLINAAGTNYAKITATVTKKIGSSVIWSSGCTFTANKRSGDSALSVSANTYVKGANRGTTEGSERSAVFYGTYQPESAYSTLTTSDFTVTQQENRSTTSSLTQSFSVSSPQKITSDGVRTRFMGTLHSYYWYKYTSGSVLPTTGYYEHHGGASATTYSIPSSAGGWISTQGVSDGTDIIFARNTSSTSRSADITVGYKSGDDPVAVTSTTTVEQYRAPYTTTTYTITSYGAYPETGITATSYGTGNHITITGKCQYQEVVYKDGTSTTGSTGWYTGNPSGTDCFAMLSGSSTGHWAMYNGSTTASTQMNLSFNQETKVGTTYVYPVSANTSQDDIVQGIYLHMGSDEKTFEVRHKGTSNVNINVSPTSGTVQNAGGSTTFTVTSNVAGWTVSTNWPSWTRAIISGGTAATGSTRVTVSTIGSEYTGTTDRSATISVKNGSTTYATYKFTQKGYVPPAINNIDELYQLGDGWIVGRYVLSTSQTPYIYQIVIVRADAGVDTHFSFGSDGYYGTHNQSGTVTHNWIDPPLITYGINYQSGTVFQTTDGLGRPISCYGVSVAGAVGQNAETGSMYSKISYSST